MNCCNLSNLKRPGRREQQGNPTESDDLQYFGMSAVFRLEDNTEQFSPQLRSKAADRGYVSLLAALDLQDHYWCWAPGRKALNPFQGTLLIPCMQFLLTVLGVLRTELKVLQSDTALLASTELKEFTPWRFSLQLLTVSTSVDIHPTNTYIFPFFPFKNFCSKLSEKAKTL